MAALLTKEQIQWLNGNKGQFGITTDIDENTDLSTAENLDDINRGLMGAGFDPIKQAEDVVTPISADSDENSKDPENNMANSTQQTGTTETPKASPSPTTGSNPSQVNTGPQNSGGFNLDAMLNNPSTKNTYQGRYGALRDGVISRKEAHDLGISGFKRRRLNRAVEHGNNSRIQDFVNSGQKRIYVSNGKFITEGGAGWDENAFNAAQAAGYGGYNQKAVGEAYNNAVNDWRKNAEITYDPYTDKFMAKGFNGGADVDVTNSEWFKNGRMKTMSDDIAAQQKTAAANTYYDPTTRKYMYKPTDGGDAVEMKADWFTKNEDMQRNAQLQAFGNAVNTYENSGAPTNYADLIKTIGYKGIAKNGKKGTYYETDLSKMSADQRKAAIDEIGKLAMEHYKGLSTPNGVGGWDSAVKADAWWKNVQSNFANDANLKNAFAWDPNGRYATYLKGQPGSISGSGSGFSSGDHAGNLLGLKQGGTINFNRARAYKSGGNIPKAQLGATIFGKDSAWGKGLDFGLSFIPGVNTANQALGYAQGNVSGAQLALAAGMDLLGPAAKLAGGLYKGYKVYKGANAAVNTLKNADKAYKTVAKTLPEYQRVAKLEKMLASAKKTKDVQKIARIEKDLSAANTQLYKQMAKNPATSKIVTDLNKASAAARTAAPVSKKTAYAIGKATNPFKGSFFNPTKGLGWTGKGLYWGARGLAGTSNATGMTDMLFGGGGNSQPTVDTTPNVVPESVGSGYSYGSGYGSEYGSSSENSQTSSGPNPGESMQDYWARTNGQVQWAAKNGGILKMRNLNYYQEGGAVAPAPVQGGGSALEMVLSDEQMASMFCQAMSQQMGQEVTPDALIQLVQQNPQAAEQLEAIAQQFIQQVQGAQSAKRGAKLSYIKSLKSGCPEGYEVSYNKKGGRLCKECVKKAQIGAKLRKGFETAVNAVSPGEALYNPENQKTVSRQLFGKVGDAFNPASMVRGAAVHQKGGNLSSKEQQDLNAAISRNKKKHGTKYDTDQLAGRKSVGKDNKGRDLYLNGEGEAMPMACKGGKTKKCAAGGFLTLENLQSTYRNLNK